eukprot:Protomagalhaensia_wolfi_Nauph_80__2296@NODE_24_length_4807_cov_26_465604_g19_i0_p3_GENE_NODE_24_length_4807_cov_26_465604_g19_i0NODE_24_length_4807_cov_26_465604_g19_i0_p3_ORF_typecomplete_len216_score41_25Med22/PF06179_12/0_069_NODE_24_length_4807_cov_26_465604_g19_i028033450
MENQPVSEILHKIVETHKIKLLHHFSNFLLCLQINPQRRPLDSWHISQLQAQVHLLNILHSCRCFLQLASDLTTMQTVYNMEERRRQADVETERLKALMQRLSAMYLSSQLPPIHNRLTVQRALAAVFHKTATAGVPAETGLLASAVAATPFFKTEALPTRSGDVLTSKRNQALETIDTIDSADAAVNWLRAERTTPPPPRRKQDILHSRIMLHP